jgi:hypothetical protein
MITRALHVHNYLSRINLSNGLLLYTSPQNLAAGPYVYMLHFSLLQLDLKPVLHL